jgi:hypothetical protein
MHACTRYLIAAILSCCDIVRVSTRRSWTSCEESSNMQCLLWILKREKFDKFAVFVVDLEERRTPTNLQCLLWILKREGTSTNLQCLLWSLKREVRQIYSVCCGSWREKELRQICSVCCGPWREKNFDKSTVFVVDLEERRTSTNLRSVFCVWKKKRVPQLHCIDQAHIVRKVVYTHRYGS